MVLGPSGIGLYSLLKQCLAAATVVATLYPQAALAHTVARGDRARATDVFLAGAMLVVLGSTASVLCAGLIFAEALAGWLIPPGVASSRDLIALLAIPIVFNVAFVVLLGVLQGRRAIGAASAAAIVGAAVTAGISYPMAEWAAAGNLSALIGLLVAGPFCSAIVAAALGMRAGWLLPALAAFRACRVNAANMRSFVRMSVVGMLTALVTAMSLLAIRSMIAHGPGLREAGLFDAAWTISHATFGMLLAAFGSYYLPALIAADRAQDRERLVNAVIFLVTLVVVPAIVVAQAFCSQLIGLLYTPEFLEAGNTLRWMLVGEYFRSAAWALSFLALARARMGIVLLADSLWCLGFLGVAYHGATEIGSIEVLGYAYAALYAAYLVFLAVIVINRDGARILGSVACAWLGGLALVAAAAAITWSQEEAGIAVRLLVCAGSIGAAALAWRCRHRIAPA
jgi:PST family polysaccharide transporter